MAIEHYLYLDTPATRHELRDALVYTSIELEAAPDWKNTSCASSAATNVVIMDERGHFVRPDNGVVATRSVMFRDRKLYLSKPDAPYYFKTQTILGVLALLKAFPEADAYWVGWDAEVPMLLRRGGRIVLALGETGPGEFWGVEGSPERALVDLPYKVEPLGPWPSVRVEEADPRAVPAAAS